MSSDNDDSVADAAWVSACVHETTGRINSGLIRVGGRATTGDMPRAKRVPLRIDVESLFERISRPLGEKERVYLTMVAAARAAGAVQAFKEGHLEAVPVKVVALADYEISPDHEALRRAEMLVLPRYAARRALRIEWEAMCQLFPELEALNERFEHHCHVIADVIADGHGSGSPDELGRWLRNAYEEDQAERAALKEPLLADAPGVLAWEARSSRFILALYDFAFGLEWRDAIPWSSPRTLEQGFNNWLDATYWKPAAPEHDP